MQTMTWLASRTSSAYSNSATKASFDPLSVICADSTRTYNLPFHKTASQPAALLSSLPVVKLAFACVSEITRGRPLQFLTRKRSLKVDLVLGSNAWLAGSEGFRCSPTPVPCNENKKRWYLVSPVRKTWEITTGQNIHFEVKIQCSKKKLGNHNWSKLTSGKSQLEWATSGAPFGHAAQRNTHLRGLASLSHGTLVGSRGTITTHG